MRMINILAGIITLSAVSAFAMDNTGASGFGGLNWGSALTQGADWQQNSVEGKQSFYTRTSDRLEYGDAKLDYILYGFYKNKLSSVRFQSTGLSNKEALIQAMDERYGNATRDEAQPGLYIWQGRQTQVSVDCRASSNVCAVHMEAHKGGKTRASSE